LPLCHSPKAGATEGAAEKTMAENRAVAREKMAELLLRQGGQPRAGWSQHNEIHQKRAWLFPAGKFCPSGIAGGVKESEKTRDGKERISHTVERIYDIPNFWLRSRGEIVETGRGGANRETESAGPIPCPRCKNK